VNFLTSVSYLACNDKNITQHPSSGWDGVSLIFVQAGLKPTSSQSQPPK
jgi:hypothetical protein